MLPADYSNIFNAQTGVLIGVPIPEAYEQKSSAIQKAVEDAIRAAEIDGVAKRGKEVTPWILAKVKELTGGESVESSALQGVCFMDVELNAFGHRHRSDRKQRQSWC